MRRPSILSHAIRVGLGLAMAVQTLPALALEQIPDSSGAHYKTTSTELVETFQQNYGHLSDTEQAEAILTQSGVLAIDAQAGILYAPQGDINLLGCTFDELAALAWGVPTVALTRDQRYATYRAMEALRLDSTLPYGTLPQVKATVLKRSAQTMGEQELIRQQGISESNATALDGKTLELATKALFSYIAQTAGQPRRAVIDLTERTSSATAVLSNGENAQPQIIIAGTNSILRGQVFDPLSDVIALDAEDGILTNKLVVQGLVDTTRVGNYELKYTVTDSQGQTTAALRTVAVTLNESDKPRISGAGPKLIFTEQDFDPMTGVTAWDTEDGDLSSKITVSGSVDTSKAGIYLLTYSVMDKDGHSCTRNRIVLVENLRAKSISFSGLLPELLNLYDDFDPMAGVTASDETDGDITGQITVTNPVDTSQGGVYRVRYDVSNSQGASKTRYKTVIVQNSLPRLALSVDKHTAILVGETFDPTVGITATDREDGDLTNRIQVSGEVNNQVPGVYTLRYQVQDNNGGVETLLRRITVKNTTTPDNTVPTIQAPILTTVPVDGSFDPMAGVTANDAEDGDLSAAIQVFGEVDTTVPGYYQLTYSVMDSMGTVGSVDRTVNVDNHVPTIRGANGLLLPLGAPFNPMEGITASDKEDGDLTSAVQVTGSVDTSKGGLYSLLYTVTDRHGAEGYALRAVVVENNVPTIAGLDAVTITHGQAFDPLAGVTATDTEDGDITGNIQVSDNLDTTRPGAYVLTYTVKDSGGALATGMRGVVVKNTIPDIQGIAPATITVGDPFDPFAGITASDAEDGDLTTALQVSGDMDSTKPGIYTLHYLVKDSQGASARRGRVVTVKAAYNNAPVINGVSATTIIAGQAFTPLAGITATDEEDGDLSSAITVSGSVDTTKAGRYRLTYRVKDSGGKSDTAYRMVTVTNTAPVLHGISSLTISAGTEFDPLAGITATDGEEGDLTSKITVTGSVDAMKAGIYTLRYRVEDSFGRYATKSRKVSVSNSAPVLQGIGRVSIPYGSTFDVLAGVSATDEEDGDITSKISVSGSVDTSDSGNHHIKYTVTDNHGKTTTRSRTVHVKSRLFS